MLSLVVCRDDVVTRHGTRFLKSGKSNVIPLRTVVQPVTGDVFSAILSPTLGAKCRGRTL